MLYLIANVKLHFYEDDIENEEHVQERGLINWQMDSNFGTDGRFSPISKV